VLRHEHLPWDVAAHGRRCCLRPLIAPSPRAQVHTGEKPYRCKLCAYRTHIVGNLKKHNRVHARRGEIAPPDPPPGGPGASSGVGPGSALGSRQGSPGDSPAGQADASSAARRRRGPGRGAGTPRHTLPPSQPEAPVADSSGIPSGTPCSGTTRDSGDNVASGT